MWNGAAQRQGQALPIHLLLMLSLSLAPSLAESQLTPAAKRYDNAGRPPPFWTRRECWNVVVLLFLCWRSWVLSVGRCFVIRRGMTCRDGGHGVFVRPRLWCIYIDFSILQEANSPLNMEAWSVDNQHKTLFHMQIFRTLK